MLWKNISQKIINMNNKFYDLLKNFSYTLSSNLVSLIISVLVVLIVPKVLGVEEYGYWQLYIFYASYTALLHFGWNDGIYLRYGGKKYEELDKDLFFSQFWMLAIFELFITVLTIILAGFIVDNPDRLFIIRMMVLCSLIVIPRGMLLFILQGTNRIKEYAVATMIGRITYSILIILFIFCGIKEYPLMIAADIIGKFISLVCTIIYCKAIVFRKIASFYVSLSETIENVSVGIKIVVAYIASSLIVGTVRFGIENIWDVATFGKVSLTLSISNLMMVFINAVGLILFPVLRRTNESKLPGIYIDMRNLLTIPLMGALVGYFPLKAIMTIWLPQYSESLIYMGILFPMALFEGKMSLLINTYLKTLRKERELLFINILSLGLSLFSTAICVFILKNLTISVFSILILLMFRCVLAEIYVSKIINISIASDTIIELIMTLIFIFAAWFVGSWMGATIYFGAYLLYLIIKRKDITDTIKNIKLLMVA